ncbi:MAG: hypothetical protein J7K73_03215 [Nanoarchaeota archaeon]|nr:hypothetical protein [Nanoarchaeota archaeon]
MEYALLGDARVEILDKELKPLGLLNVPKGRNYILGLYLDGILLLNGDLMLEVPISEIERMSDAKEIDKDGLLVRLKGGTYVIINSSKTYRLNALRHYINPLILT